MEVIAHRGASAYAPENSFAAFDLALAQGADRLELDVRSTSDGRLVVLHDSRLLRTARDPRAIAAVCADDLMSIDAAARPPTRDAVLDRCGSATRWLVELKDPTPASARALGAALTARRLEHVATVQSFDAGLLRRLRWGDAVARRRAAVRAGTERAATALGGRVRRRGGGPTRRRRHDAGLARTILRSGDARLDGERHGRHRALGRARRSGGHHGRPGCRPGGCGRPCRRGRCGLSGAGRTWTVRRPSAARRAWRR